MHVRASPVVASRRAERSDPLRATIAYDGTGSPSTSHPATAETSGQPIERVVHEEIALLGVGIRGRGRSGQADRGEAPSSGARIRCRHDQAGSAVDALLRRRRATSSWGRVAEAGISSWPAPAANSMLSRDAVLTSIVPPAAGDGHDHLEQSSIGIDDERRSAVLILHPAHQIDGTSASGRSSATTTWGSRRPRSGAFSALVRSPTNMRSAPGEWSTAMPISSSPYRRSGIGVGAADGPGVRALRRIEPRAVKGVLGRRCPDEADPRSDRRDRDRVDRPRGEVQGDRSPPAEVGIQRVVEDQTTPSR